MKNSADLGGCYRPLWITSSLICRILHILRKPNSIIAKYLIFFINSLCDRSISPSTIPSTEDSTYRGFQSINVGYSGRPLNLQFEYFPQTLFSENFCYDSSFFTVQKKQKEVTCAPCPTMIFADFRFEFNNL